MNPSKEDIAYALDKFEHLYGIYGEHIAPNLLPDEVCLSDAKAREWAKRYNVRHEPKKGYPTCEVAAAMAYARREQQERERQLRALTT